MSAAVKVPIERVEVGRLTAAQLAPGGRTVVTATSPAGPREFRPSWAVLGRGLQFTVWSVDAPPCAGTVWTGEFAQPFDGELHLAQQGCGRGDGHEGRCAP